MSVLLLKLHISTRTYSTFKRSLQSRCIFLHTCTQLFPFKAKKSFAFLLQRWDQSGLHQILLPTSPHRNALFRCADGRRVGVKTFNVTDHISFPAPSRLKKDLWRYRYRHKSFICPCRAIQFLQLTMTNTLSYCTVMRTIVRNGIG